MSKQISLKLLPGRAEMERALLAHDGSYDGVFYCAVRTTGIFCRPGCRPPRSPRLENIEFFATARECVAAGYRPCKLCRPTANQGGPPQWLAGLIERVEAQPEVRVTAGNLRELGLTPERVRRWFVDNHGMTFAAWCRGRRLSGAFNQIRQGDALDDVVFANGYESHSGFREAFGKTFGTAPGHSRNATCLVTRIFDTPLGRMLAAANDDGLAFLEFDDRRMVETNYQIVRERFGCPVIPGEHPHLERLETELTRYFAGDLRDFGVPVVPRGTPFQDLVWSELRRIPYGATISYDELARRISRPTAQRAVARANGDNRIAIVIPCHRVIGKDGSLTGYGGGLWRKRLLLELERTGQWPA